MLFLMPMTLTHTHTHGVLLFAMGTLIILNIVDFGFSSFVFSQQVCSRPSLTAIVFWVAVTTNELNVSSGSVQYGGNGVDLLICPSIYLPIMVLMMLLSKPYFCYFSFMLP